MYVYDVYTTLLNSLLQLPNCHKRAETSHL